MIRRACLFLLPLFWPLFGCQTPAALSTAQVPVATPCIEQVEEKPEWFDNEAAIRGTYDRGENVDARIALMLAGRLQRDRFIDGQQAELRACASR